MSVVGILNTLSPFVNRRAKSYCKGTLCLIKKKAVFNSPGDCESPGEFL